MLTQLGQRRAARGHRQHLRSDGTPATHVVRGVADDDDLLATQRRSERTDSTVAGDGSNVVPVLRVVRKRADVKCLPQPEMA